MKLLSLILVCLLTGCATRELSEPLPPPPPWGAAVSQELTALGFGNWVVVAESSFPVHSGRGMRTVTVDAEIPEIVDYIVDSYDNAENVTPTFSTARELPFVKNDNAPGIDQFRKRLKTSLHGHKVREMDFRSLRLLAQSSSKKFAILVIKTQTALPYSNVFIELDTGYWDRESEDSLRAAMKKRADAAAAKVAAAEAKLAAAEAKAKAAEAKAQAAEVKAQAAEAQAAEAATAAEINPIDSL